MIVNAIEICTYPDSNGRSRIELKCPQCGETTFTQIWGYVSHGKKCPKCGVVLVRGR